MPTNRVDLDPHVRNFYGFPVARITYKGRLQIAVALAHYTPKVEGILREAGAIFVLTVPGEIATGGIPNPPLTACP